MDFIHPEDREMVTQRYLARLGGEDVPSVYTFRVIDKGGNTVWVELRVSPVQWAGRPATLNMVTDVTERVRIEQALRESEEKYRSVVENAKEGILVLQDGQIKFANDAFGIIYLTRI